MKKIIITVICVIAAILSVSCGNDNAHIEPVPSAAKNHGNGAFIYRTAEDAFADLDYYGGSYVDAYGDLCIVIVTDSALNDDMKKMAGYPDTVEDEKVKTFLKIIESFGFNAENETINFIAGEYSLKTLRAVQEKLNKGADELSIAASYIDEKLNSIVVEYIDDTFNSGKVARYINNEIVLAFVKVGSISED